MIKQIVDTYWDSLKEDSISPLRVITEKLLDSGPAARSYLYTNQSGCRITTYILFTMIYFKCANPQVRPFLKFVRPVFFTLNPMIEITLRGLSRNQKTRFPSRLNESDTLTIVQILRSEYELNYRYSPTHTFLIYKDRTKKENNYTVFSSWNPPMIPLIVTPNQSFTDLRDFIDNMSDYPAYQKKLFGIDEPIHGSDRLKIVCFTDNYIKDNFKSVDICNSGVNSNNNRTLRRKMRDINRLPHSRRRSRSQKSPHSRRRSRSRNKHPNKSILHGNSLSNNSLSNDESPNETYYNRKRGYRMRGNNKTRGRSRKRQEENNRTP
jgi:hypothetical protein